jgi:hypothetical protein
MLEASPKGVPLGAAESAAAIDACLTCVQSGTSCATGVGEGEWAVQLVHARLAGH